LPVDRIPPAVEAPFAFGGSTFSFLRPRNPDDVLEEITVDRFNRDEFLPYWTDHWPSAGILLDYLAQAPLPPPATVLELGSGLGIIAAVLSLTHPKVIATDISFSACHYSLRNMASVSGTGRCVCCDWRTAAFKEPFDLIIGSDILYERRWTTPIISFVNARLSPNGRALIADPRRPYWWDFQEEAEQAGLTCSIVRQEKTNNGKTTVEILEMRRKITN
jgi:ETFB lysine methyltransferase